VIIVSNTTPLSELAKVGQLNLLQKLFGDTSVNLHLSNNIFPKQSSCGTSFWFLFDLQVELIRKLVRYGRLLILVFCPN